MTNYEKLLLRLIKDNKLKEYYVINLEFANYCYKHDIDPSIKDNICPTITTRCLLAVVVTDSEKRKEFI